MANRRGRHEAPTAEARVIRRRKTENIKEGAQPATASVEAARNSDFNSILLVFDHLMFRKDGHVVQKMVMSTQNEVESLLSIIHYYGETRILANASMVKVMQEGGQSANPCYIFTSKENVSAVMSVQTWALFVNHPDWGNGSELQATDLLCRSIAQFHAKIKNQNNGYTTPLLVISPELVQPSQAQ